MRQGCIKRRRLTLVEIVITLVFLGLLAGFLTIKLASARRHASQTFCEDNIRKIAQAVRFYQKEYGAMPYAPFFLDDFRPIWGYLGDFKTFRCPAQPGKNGLPGQVSDLDGKTDYLFFPGEAVFADEKAPLVYGVRPHLPKFERLRADKIREPAVYDKGGPHHPNGINLYLFKSSSVEQRNEMCELWVLDADRKLILDATTSFPRP